MRNIGGLIVIDFIDMTSSANRQKLFKYLEKTLKERDKFQSVVLRVSEFGLVQMTRKRSGKTLIQQMTETCKTCHGKGFIKSMQTETYSILQNLSKRSKTKKISGNITLEVHNTIFSYITETEYNSILLLEKLYRSKITLIRKETGDFESYAIDVEH